MRLDEYPGGDHAGRGSRVRPAADQGFRANANYTYLDTNVNDDGGIGGQNTFPEGQPLLRRRATRAASPWAHSAIASMRTPRST